MKVKTGLVLLLCAAVLLSLSGCLPGGGKSSSSQASSSAPQEEIDPNWPVQVGDVTLEKKPQRVVSLSPATTELLYELGASEQVAGVSDFCDYPVEVSGLPACGTSASPDWEVIKQLKPQLVVSSTPLTQQDTIRLQQMNAAVVVFSRVSSVEALEERYLAAGTLLGGMVDGAQNGEAVYAALRDKYSALTAAVKRVELAHSGVWLRATPLMMATGDTLEGKLLEEALGVKNDAAEYTGWEYPAEKAVDLYPDVIYYDRSIDPEYFKGTQVYNTTDAYKKDRLYPFDALVFERQSGRMFDELIRMFGLAYPDITVHIGATPQANEPGSAESTSSLSGIVEEPKDD